MKNQCRILTVTIIYIERITILYIERVRERERGREGGGEEIG